MFDGLRAWISNPLRVFKRTSEGESIFWSDFWARERGFGNTPAVLPPDEAYSKVVAVYRCMLVSASLLGAVPLVPYRGDRKLETGPEAELLLKPNPFMRTDDLLEMVVVHLKGMLGKAFIQITDIDSRGPHTLKVIPPSRVTADCSPTNAYDLHGWFVRRENGAQEHVDPKEMIFVKIAPDQWGNPLYSTGPLQPALGAARADYAASVHNQRLFGSNTPPGLLRNKGRRLEAPDLKSLEKQFAEETRPGQLKFVNADIEFQALNDKIKDMEYRSGREWNRDEICAAMNVDPFFLGVEQHSGLSDVGITTRYQKQYQADVQPLGRKIEAAITDGLRIWFGADFSVRFDWDTVEALRENYVDKLDIALKMKQLGVPYNEIIESLDLGTKPVPWGDSAYTLITNTTYQAIQDAAELGIAVARVTETMPAAEPSAEGATPATEVPAQVEQQKQLPAPAGHPPAEPPPALPAKAMLALSRREFEALVTGSRGARTQLWRAYLAQHGPVENKIASKVKSVLTKQRVAVLHALESKKRVLKRDKITDDEAPSQSQVDDATDAVDELAIAGAVRPLVISGYAGAAHVMLDHLSGVGVVDDSAVKVAERRIPKLATEYYDRRIDQLVEIGDRVKAAVGETLAEGFAKGENLSDLKDRVREVFNSSASRARTIARTEASIAVNTGRVELMRSQGITQLEWLSAQDEKVRDSHQIDGEVIDMGDTFSNGLEYPGDENGPPEEVINCRCSPLPHIEGTAAAAEPQSDEAA